MLGVFQIGNPREPECPDKLCRINYFQLTPVFLPFWSPFRLLVLKYYSS